MGQPFDETLDVKELVCPMPMLKTKKALAKMQPGQILQVVATDHHAVEDLKQFCEQTKNVLLNVECVGEFYYFLIQRKMA